MPKSLHVAASAILVSLSVPALAADFPKNGQAEYDTYYVFDTRASIPENQFGTAGIDEFSGINRNVKGEGPFNDMSVHCISYWSVFRDEFNQSGSCVETDRDGDMVLTTFDADNHYIQGGTGKYKGITGKAPFKVTELHNTAGGRAARIVNHKVTWEIK